MKLIHGITTGGHDDYIRRNGNARRAGYSRDDFDERKRGAGNQHHVRLVRGLGLRAADRPVFSAWELEGQAPV